MSQGALAALVAIIAAGAAVYWVVPGSTRDDGSRLGPSQASRDTLRATSWWPMRPSRRWAVVALVAAPVSGLALDGSRGAAVAVAIVATGVTVAALVHGWRSRRAGRRRAGEIAHGARVLAGQLAVGLVPGAALVVAAEDCPVLVEAAAVERLGGSVARHWRVAGRAPGADGLLRLAVAWELSASTGAPLAPALERVAESLAEEYRVAGLLDAELAPSRATARLLAGLPVVGLGLGFALGGDPVAFLLDEPIGQVCLVAGVVLACLGSVWADRLAGGGADVAADRRTGSAVVG